MNGYDLSTPPPNPMFIEFEVRRGMVELYGQQVAALRADTRYFGTRANAMFRAGRKIISVVNPCHDCGHKAYDPLEYLVDCNTPRCPKNQLPKTLTLTKRG